MTEVLAHVPALGNQGEVLVLLTSQICVLRDSALPPTPPQYCEPNLLQYFINGQVKGFCQSGTEHRVNSKQKVYNLGGNSCRQHAGDGGWRIAVS